MVINWCNTLLGVLDDDFTMVNQLMKFVKFGFGRVTDQVQEKIQYSKNPILAEKYDEIEPSVLQYYLQITSLSKDEFYDVIGKKRLKQLDGKTVSVVSKKYKKIKKPFVLEFIENVRKKVKKERLEWRINES